MVNDTSERDEGAALFALVIDSILTLARTSGRTIDEVLTAVVYAAQTKAQGQRPVIHAETDAERRERR